MCLADGTILLMARAKPKTIRSDMIPSESCARRIRGSAGNQNRYERGYSKGGWGEGGKKESAERCLIDQHCDHGSQISLRCGVKFSMRARALSAAPLVCCSRS